MLAQPLTDSRYRITQRVTAGAAASVRD